MSNEDKRTAVGISVNLSTQLIAAALATLAIEGAYAAYALGDRNVERGFSLLCVLSVLLLVVSIFLAGRGITDARNSGYDGNWDLTIGKKQFNWQAILCALALLLFGVALLRSGTPKLDGSESKALELQAEFHQMKAQLLALDNGHSAQEDSIADTRATLERMEETLRALQEGAVD